MIWRPSWAVSLRTASRICAPRSWIASTRLICTVWRCSAKCQGAPVREEAGRSRSQTREIFPPAAIPNRVYNSPRISTPGPPLKTSEFAPRVLLVNRQNMISEKQLEANRRNAQHSTGPRTEEGKKVSALNARRHNLPGQVTAMTDADRIMHDAFSAAIVENLAPE